MKRYFLLFASSAFRKDLHLLLLHCERKIFLEYRNSFESNTLKYLFRIKMRIYEKKEPFQYNTQMCFHSFHRYFFLIKKFVSILKFIYRSLSFEMIPFHAIMMAVNMKFSSTFTIMFITFRH